VICHIPTEKMKRGNKPICLWQCGVFVATGQLRFWTFRQVPFFARNIMLWLSSLQGWVYLYGRSGLKYSTMGLLGGFREQEILIEEST